MILWIDWVAPLLVSPGFAREAAFSKLVGLENTSWPCSYVWWLVLAFSRAASVLSTVPSPSNRLN